jgi:Endoplasmic reticulum protein ERp29, C-terminal domain
MKGVMQKGDDFIRLQGDRMSKLLKDKLSEKQIIDLNKKLNILASFKFRESIREEL